jgi:multiple sugar transport system substrate-binding protein
VAPSEAIAASSFRRWPPTMPVYEAYNPAIAQVNAEHAFSVAEYDVMKEGMAPEAAIDKAFKRADEIFAKYPITQA